VWDEQDPETRCNACKKRNLSCGPDEYMNKNDQGELEAIPNIGQIFGAGGGAQLVGPVPNGLVYTEEKLRSR